MKIILKNKQPIYLIRNDFTQNDVDEYENNLFHTWFWAKERVILLIIDGFYIIDDKIFIENDKNINLSFNGNYVNVKRKYLNNEMLQMSFNDPVIRDTGETEIEIEKFHFYDNENDYTICFNLDAAIGTLIERMKKYLDANK